MEAKSNMEVKKITVDGIELDFIISSDDEVERKDKIGLDDTLDLTDVATDIKTIIGSSDLNE